MCCCVFDRKKGLEQVLIMSCLCVVCVGGDGKVRVLCLCVCVCWEGL
jgi:hypothetical protein